MQEPRALQFLFFRFSLCFHVNLLLVSVDNQGYINLVRCSCFIRQQRLTNLDYIVQ